MAAVTSIMRVQQILLGQINDLLRPLGLNFPRYEALMLLLFSLRGALPLGKMGERLQVHATSVTNIVDRLESDGFVRRSPHSRDRRTVLAEITPSGRRVAGRATRILNEASFSMSPFTSKELEGRMVSRRPQLGQRTAVFPTRSPLLSGVYRISTTDIASDQGFWSTSHAHSNLTPSGFTSRALRSSAPSPTATGVDRELDGTAQNVQERLSPQPRSRALRLPGYCPVGLAPLPFPLAIHA